MRTVRCPDCGRPAVEVGRFTVDDTEYARLRCGDAPALLLPASALTPAPVGERGWPGTAAG